MLPLKDPLLTLNTSDDACPSASIADAASCPGFPDREQALSPLKMGTSISAARRKDFQFDPSFVPDCIVGSAAGTETGSGSRTGTGEDAVAANSPLTFPA